MNDYVIASCKLWHKPEFERFSAHHVGNWHWVDSPASLESVLKEIKPRYVFFLHWSWIVPAVVWQSNECVCFHMTDVPYGRGGSPLQNLILNGHKTTKLTALRMVQELDSGPVYRKCDLSLDGRAEDIYIRAGKLSFELIKWIIENKPQPIDQEGSVTIFKRRRPDQSIILSSLKANEIYDFIRMLDAPGYPHAFIFSDGIKVSFTKAEFKDGRLTATASFEIINENTE